MRNELSRVILFEKTPSDVNTGFESWRDLVNLILFVNGSFEAL
jgi:hypothetical protein